MDSSRVRRVKYSLHRLYQILLRKLYRLISRPGPEHEQINLVSNSGLFDTEWYLTQYPDVMNSTLDPVLHYLRYGVNEARDPGPEFSTSWYLDTYPDVASAGMNPLIHYLVHGKQEGRLISPSYLLAGPDTIFVVADDDVVPMSFPVPQRLEPVWTRQVDMTLLHDHDILVMSGIHLGYIQPGLFTAGKNTLASGFLQTMVAFSSMTGREPAKSIQLYREKKTFDISGLLTELTGKPARANLVFDNTLSELSLVDIWYINTNELRLRFSLSGSPAEAATFVVRAYQYSDTEPGSIGMIAEYPLAGNLINIVDFKVDNPFMPLMVTFSTDTGHLQSISLLPFPSLCRAGLHYGELCADHAQTDYINKLMTISNEYMSAMSMAADNIPYTIAAVRINLQGATGAEPVFSPCFHTWLAKILNVRVLPGEMSKHSNNKVSRYLEQSLAAMTGCLNANDLEKIEARLRQGGWDLVLPADGVPTISALLRRQAAAANDKSMLTCSFVVCDRWSMQPKWHVLVPSVGSELLDLQPVHAPPAYPILSRVSTTHPITAGPGDISGSAFAVRFCHSSVRDDASMISPLGPGVIPPILRCGTGGIPESANPITVVLTAGEGVSVNLPALLESLHLQSLAADLHIIAVVEGGNADLKHRVESILNAGFPQQYELVTGMDSSHADKVRQAAVKAPGSFLLFINQNVILHDPRTLAVLCQMADSDSVATASCMLISRASDGSKRKLAHYSAAILLSQTGTGPACVNTDIYSIMGLTTCPVVTNSGQLLMTRKDTWLQIQDLAPDSDAISFDHVDFGVKALAMGYYNYCTTAISASVHPAPVINSRDDMTGLPGTLPPALVETITNSTVRFRAIYP